MHKIKTFLLVIFLLNCYLPLNSVSTSAQLGVTGKDEFIMNKNTYNFTLSFDKSEIQKSASVEFDLSVQNTTSPIGFEFTTTSSIVSIYQNNQKISGDIVKGSLTQGNTESILIKLTGCMNDNILDLVIVFTKTTTVSPLIDIGTTALSTGKDNCLSSLQLFGFPFAPILFIIIIPDLVVGSLAIWEIRRRKRLKNQKNELYPKINKNQ